MATTLKFEWIRTNPGLRMVQGPSTSRVVRTRGKITHRVQNRTNGSTARRQSLIKIRDDVLGILDPHRDANIFGRNTRLYLLLGRELRMRRRSRMNHQCLGIPDIRQMASEFDALDKLLTRFFPPLIPNPRIAPAPSGRYFRAAS